MFDFCFQFLPGNASSYCFFLPKRQPSAAVRGLVIWVGGLESRKFDLIPWVMRWLEKIPARIMYLQSHMIVFSFLHISYLVKANSDSPVYVFKQVLQLTMELGCWRYQCHHFGVSRKHSGVMQFTDGDSRKNKRWEKQSKRVCRRPGRVEIP